MISRKELFKVCRKIVCVGRNYKDHVAELNNELPTKPLLFLKPPSSLISEGEVIRIPEGCQSLHHEVELGVVINKEGSCIPEDQVMSHVGGFTLSLDMTARDFQEEAKKNSHPWLLAKCWDTFCPVSEVVPSKDILDVNNVSVWLKVNGQMRQTGNSKDMIFPIPYLISYISRIMTLQQGDLILTGTPSGVGPVKSGDVIECGLEGINNMKFSVQ